MGKSDRKEKVKDTSRKMRQKEGAGEVPRWASRSIALGLGADCLLQALRPCLEIPELSRVGFLVCKKGMITSPCRLWCDLCEMMHAKHFLVTLPHAILELQYKVEFLPLYDKMCLGIKDLQLCLYSLFIFFFYY